MLPLSAQVSRYFSIEAAIFGRRNWAEAPGEMVYGKTPSKLSRGTSIKPGISDRSFRVCKID